MFLEKKAFSLAELMIVITLMAILALGVSQFNFYTITEAEKILGFSNKIINAVELSKGYELLGKGVQSTTITTKGWRTNLPIASGGQITISYKNASNVWVSLGLYGYTLSNQERITQVRCLDYQGNTLETINTSTTINIVFENGASYISGCSDSNTRMLDLDVQLLDSTRTKILRFSTLNKNIWIQ